MSSSQLVDGKTGEPIGQNIYYTSTSNYAVGGGVPTTTSSYVPGYTTTTTTNHYGSGSAAHQSHYNTTAQYAVGSGSQYTQNIVGTSVNTGKEVIKGESRIEYVPFEKKIIEYKDQAKVERIPKKVKKTEYREERKVETIPREVTVTDYYAVEYLRQYIPQYVPEKRVEYIQVPKKQVRYEYIPVERQIVHYPDQALESQYGYQQGGYQQTGYTTTTTNGGQYITGGTAGYAIEQPTQQYTYSSSTAVPSQTVYATGPTGTTTYETIGADRHQYYSSSYQGSGSGVRGATGSSTYVTGGNVGGSNAYVTGGNTGNSYPTGTTGNYDYAYTTADYATRQ